GRDPAHIRGRLRQGSPHRAPRHTQIFADEYSIRARRPKPVWQSAVDHDRIDWIAAQTNGALLPLFAAIRAGREPAVNDCEQQLSGVHYRHCERRDGDSVDRPEAAKALSTIHADEERPITQQIDAVACRSEGDRARRCRPIRHDGTAPTTVAEAKDTSG